MVYTHTLGSLQGSNATVRGQVVRSYCSRCSRCQQHSIAAHRIHHHCCTDTNRLGPLRTWLRLQRIQHRHSAHQWYCRQPCTGVEPGSCTHRCCPGPSQAAGKLSDPIQRSCRMDTGGWKRGNGWCMIGAKLRCVAVIDNRSLTENISSASKDVMQNLYKGLVTHRIRIPSIPWTQRHSCCCCCVGSARTAMAE